MPSALILIADGTEEMEFTIVYDTLVRADVKCVSAYVSPTSAATIPEGTEQNPPFVRCSRGVCIQPDIYFTHKATTSNDYDVLVIPGGAKGAETMAGFSAVQTVVKEFYNNKKLVAMICAGSLAALSSELPSQPLTSHPSVKSELDQKFKYSEDSVVVSNNLITSRGPGTAFPFALTIVELLCGKEKREQVRGPMIFPAGTPF
ncbi:DJ-1 [Stereum hirsutum FP-91666 SS1]|uniref:DJ-1 n=1 Tax=Stereum hirsutum (strain FP-91666) TaxID=721885 RepID=UPI0004449252|nr:DJ-1 [Stereum hirsutum FP-91666 SS1]EIM82142.1 DJ-1 [Stereum hirsutum FP-91666 SS1]